MPIKKHKTDKTAEQMTTERKLFKIRILVSAGKMTRLEMSKVPISRMPSTIVIAVSSAISILYQPALTPVARAKFSSKVIAKIL